MWDENGDDELDSFFKNAYSTQNYQKSSKYMNVDNKIDENKKNSSMSINHKKVRKKSKKLVVNNNYNDINDDMYKGAEKIRDVLKIFSPKETLRPPRGRVGTQSSFSPMSKPLRILDSPSPSKFKRRKRSKKRVNPPPSNFNEAFRWIHLRDEYLEKLKAFTFRGNNIDNHNNNNKNTTNDDDDINTEVEFTEKDKIIFIALLVAYRKLSIQILQYYEKKAELPFMMSEIEDLEEYIRNMACSLDWMNVSSITDWLCIDPTENPLLSYKRLDGKWALKQAAYISEYRESASNYVETRRKLGYTDVVRPEFNEYMSTVPAELALSPIDMNQLQHLGGLIWKEYYGEVAAIETQLMDNHHHRTKLSGVTGVLASLAQALHVNEGSHPARSAEFWFFIWADYTKKQLHIRQLESNRCKVLVRKAFDGLQAWSYRSNGYRSLQIRINQKIMMNIFNSWSLYIKWCRKFNSIRRRVHLRKASLIFHHWVSFERMNQENRNFRRKKRIRLLKEIFSHIQYSAALSRHAMQTRLNTGSSFSFMERQRRRKLFNLWTRSVKIVKKTYKLFELVDRHQYTSAFIQWKEKVFPPKPKLPLRERFVRIKHVAMSHGNFLVRRLGDALKVAHAHSKNKAIEVAESMKNSSTFRKLTGQPMLTTGEINLVRKKKEDNRIMRIKTTGSISRDAILGKPIIEDK